VEDSNLELDGDKCVCQKWYILNDDGKCIGDPEAPLGAEEFFSWLSLATIVAAILLVLPLIFLLSPVVIF